MANCKSLMNVKGNLPLREIGLGAFHGDSSLLQVVMPDSMINIHTNSFDGLGRITDGATISVIRLPLIS